ncbi:hypothetical protein GOP47_0003852 [Adiantum capillus-veneris]|uniref:protein-serine/threonine phosphatase n=1 Tax=Adiantum capillus-veneris TaxID=13818 RepID=A0A9D4V6G8_ADICA|nr:hypothetical protein GOP47_0003852 [Adiantum capillus-veneris]
MGCLWCVKRTKGSSQLAQDDGEGRAQLSTELLTGRGKSKYSSSSPISQSTSPSHHIGTPLPRKKRKVRFGYSLVKGKSKHHMEDYHVAEFRVVKQKELGLFAIFDGHLGHSVAIYLQHHLFGNIIKHPGFWNEPRKALMEAYAETDKAIISKAKELGRGGSTAVTAIVVDGHKLLIANVGDSRAVLCRAGVASQLSVDHEPSTEQSSIEDMGGFVSSIPGDVPRLDGQLAVSRAFGDKSLKMHVRSDPDIHLEDIDEATEILILASDGLWKVMNNQIAVDTIRKIKDPQEAARCLTSEALALGSKDDISCIVVSFR